MNFFKLLYTLRATRGAAAMPPITSRIRKRRECGGDDRRRAWRDTTGYHAIRHTCRACMCVRAVQPRRYRAEITLWIIPKLYPCASSMFFFHARARERERERRDCRYLSLLVSFSRAFIRGLYSVISRWRPAITAIKMICMCTGHTPRAATRKTQCAFC